MLVNDAWLTFSVNNPLGQSLMNPLCLKSIITRRIINYQSHGDVRKNNYIPNRKPSNDMNNNFTVTQQI